MMNPAPFIPPRTRARIRVAPNSRHLERRNYPPHDQN